MTKLILIASVLVSIATSPVIARERPAAPAESPASATSRDDASLRRYCVVETPTGSHVSKKTCLTRQQWIDQQGVDPLAKD